jgi:hypothetical protein
MQHAFTSATFVRQIIRQTFTSVGSVLSLKEFFRPITQHTVTSTDSVSPSLDSVSGIMQHTFTSAGIIASLLISTGRFMQHTPALGWRKSYFLMRDLGRRSYYFLYRHAPGKRQPESLIAA